MHLQPFLAELIGTAILIIFGNGVVANVVLSKTKGQGGGWIVIAFGWGMGVFVAVFCVGRFSGAHLNPAVTVALASARQLAWTSVPVYIAAQMIGAVLGAVIVFAFYNLHFRATDDANAKLACFCTAPNISGTVTAFFCEVVATFLLVFPIFLMESSPSGFGALGALPVGLLVFAIGLSLGGTTGYAINPARDLGPRIAHAILPIPGKRDSDWRYAWIPVVAPLLGGLLAAFAALAARRAP
jgi:glycerol uptake facilitator protein